MTRAAALAPSNLETTPENTGHRENGANWYLGKDSRAAQGLLPTPPFSSGCAGVFHPMRQGDRSPQWRIASVAQAVDLSV
jgi:hypothetical protein